MSSWIDVVKTKNFDCLSQKYCDPYVNLFIRVSDYCDMGCPFCVYSSDKKDVFSLDLLSYILTSIKDKNININRVSFTGGEPGYFTNEVEQACKLIRSFFPEMFIIINTRKGIELNNELVNSISLSRHSINDFEIDSMIDIYGNDKLHLSCVLQKGLVDSNEKINEYIEYYSNKGVLDFGFVGLMKVNDYSVNHYVAINDLIGYRKTISMERDGCSCANFIYNKYPYPKIYQREVNNQMKCIAGNLVLDIHSLRNGFIDDPILVEGEIYGTH
jgi:organic radical activating enzyme